MLVTALPAAYLGPPKQWGLEYLDNVTEPFGVRYTETKVVTRHNERQLLLGRECLRDSNLSRGVHMMRVSHAFHLDVRSPSRALLTGDESAFGMKWIDKLDYRRGDQLICASITSPGFEQRVAVLTGDLLDDEASVPGTAPAMQNPEFAENLVHWLCD